jgi:hypothetical protein
MKRNSKEGFEQESRRKWPKREIKMKRGKQVRRKGDHRKKGRRRRSCGNIGIDGQTLILGDPLKVKLT